MTSAKVLAVVGLLAFALVAAPAAWAGVQMYHGSWIAQSFGNDNRVAGIGTVQLVSPIVTKWLQPSVNFETGGIAVLRIRFVPEPLNALMLVACLSLLGVLYRARGR